MHAGHLRVAIVGLGPKGLFALERLLHHARRRDALLDVDLFEPHPVPGAGPVYDPAQPDYLLMNFAADQLDMWCADSACVPRSRRLSFVDWRRRDARGTGAAANGAGEAANGPGEAAFAAGEARYPPRAQVGRYLAEGFELLRSRAPAGSRLTLRPLAVEAVRRSGLCWRVVAADRSTRAYDEVLVATGHRASAWAAGDGEHAAPIVPSVFPVSSRLSREAVAPGAAVAVRGFALTFIDAALALTEGRGGTFESDGHPYRVRYVPSSSGAEPSVIWPFSRSGRPMLAKPEPALAAGVPTLEDIGRRGRDRILALAAGFSLDDDLVAILSSTTGACLLAATGRRPTGESLLRADGEARGWLTAATLGAAPAYARGPAIELERSLAVGAGLHPPDLQWALGQCWRSVYPAIVQRLGHGGLADVRVARVSSARRAARAGGIRTAARQRGEAARAGRGGPRRPHARRGRGRRDGCGSHVAALTARIAAGRRRRQRRARRARRARVAAACSSRSSARGMRGSRPRSVAWRSRARRPASPAAGSRAPAWLRSAVRPRTPSSATTRSAAACIRMPTAGRDEWRCARHRPHRSRRTRPREAA